MTVYLHSGDCREVLRSLPSEWVHCCVTSPPYYGLRNYGVDGQIGLEQSPENYIDQLVSVFREVRRILRSDGTLWLNLGDSYSPARELIGVSWRVAFALQHDGWKLRQEIIWYKPNPMPESVTNRCTRAHEHIFLLCKSMDYFYDQDAIREPLSAATLLRDKTPRGRSQNGGGSKESMAGYDYRRKELGNMQSNPLGRNKHSVWTVTAKSYRDAHFATFPPDLIEPCIKAGCPADGFVLDPFSGSGTTGEVASQLNRNAILIELNKEYVELSKRRIDKGEMFSQIVAQ